MPYPGHTHTEFLPNTLQFLKVRPVLLFIFHLFSDALKYAHSRRKVVDTPRCPQRSLNDGRRRRSCAKQLLRRWTSNRSSAPWKFLTWRSENVSNESWACELWRTSNGTACAATWGSVAVRKTGSGLSGDRGLRTPIPTVAVVSSATFDSDILLQ